MRDVWRENPKRWGLREWSLSALAAAVTSAAVLTAGLSLARGSDIQVKSVRFGGDAQRTRVVIDLDRETRGRVVSDGSNGEVAVSLAEIDPGRGLSGNGAGLVRAYNLQSGSGGARINLSLARGATVERRFLLPPGDGVSHYRYVIDLKATGAPEAAVVRARAPQVRAEKPLIVIDAGHGGRDPGSQGHEVWEKAITLSAARELKAALERTGRYRVRLTRDSDVYVGHGRRVQIARDANADLFISLHADSGSDPALRGASVYTLSEQGASRAVREFTSHDDWQRDLRLPGGRDPSVDRILLDMTQRATQNRSAQFARGLLTQLESDGHSMLRQSHRAAGLAVLLAPDVPAVLLEMGFMTNPEDGRILSDERSRKRLMRSVADGIDKYFRQPNVPVHVAGTGGQG